MLALVIIAAVSALCAWIIGGILLFESAKAAEPHTVCETCDWRPDISHCFKPEETRELWDCIRHEEIESESEETN